MSTVAITGWSKGLETTRCIQLLHSAADLPLADAKRVIEKVLAGKSQELTIRSEPDALLLVSALGKLGATARIKAASEG
jgi:hypothetical protein